MYFYSMHMVSETTGWGVGRTKDQKEGMSLIQEWSIFHTTDGGCHWEVVKTWDLSYPINSFFLSEGTVWVTIGHHLTHTSNAGTTWEEVALPLTADESAVITHLTFLDARTGWLIAQIHQSSAPPKSAPLAALFHTNNGGRSWSQLHRVSRETSSFFPNGITFLTATTGWMTAGSLLLMTRDGGRTWQPQTLPLPAGVRSESGLSLQAPRFFSAHDGVLSACINNSHDGTPNGFLVFVTHDGGQSWQSQPFVIKDYNQVYEKRCRERDEKRLKEMKNGERIRWKRDLVYRGTPAPQFTDMHFGWVGRPSLEFFTTNDGGEHWEQLELDPLSEEDGAIQFINSRVGWSLIRSKDTFSTQLCKTTDGGKTWTQL
jgi:photosystem II stability/assembly factor-like uncharacterized protein